MEELLARLQERGDSAVVTQEERGYGIWVWEPTQILPRRDFKTCHVSVPDLINPYPL